MKREGPKYRHEMKYIISTAQLPLLKSRIESIMRLDPHAGKDGTYNIRSVYFDDYDNSCYYENENGTDPREKMRIRIYNCSSNWITLECKRKDHGKTLKTSGRLSFEQAAQLLEGNFLEEGNLTAVHRKLNLQMQTQLMRPVVIVDYNRTPYVYKEGNVRVTFDTDISSSFCLDKFFSEDMPKRPIMPVGYLLMEVKFDEFLPDLIYRSLNLGQLRQTAFSKYYLCRKYNLSI